MSSKNDDTTKTLTEDVTGQRSGRDSEADNPPESADVEKLRQELEELGTQAEEYKDEAARTKADFYNYRTRVERDRARDRVLAAEGTVDVLIPVLDNLDRTLEAVTDKESALYKGVAMVQKQFLGALTTLGLSIIDTSGDFDPKIHDALMVVDTDKDEESGKILQELNKGYMLGDKVLRAAGVKVGRKN